MGTPHRSENIQDDEKFEQDDEVIADVVGKIDPREPDVIQASRRKLRLMRREFATEKAYVGKVRAFMTEFGLTTLADFESVDGNDVEAHLTDLAVDGNVAPSTQDQAYYALKFLFEHAMKRDFGKIDARRSNKSPQIPTVMSKSEVLAVLSCLTGIYLLIAQLLYGFGLAAARTRPEVPVGASRVPVSVPFRFREVVSRSEDRNEASPSFAWGYLSGPSSTSREGIRIDQADYIAHIQTFVCDSFASGFDRGVE